MGKKSTVILFFHKSLGELTFWRNNIHVNSELQNSTDDVLFTAISNNIIQMYNNNKNG